ncbi:hypothetical protein ABFS82_10G117500 [Erythranthe guttata]|nr:PREDICTED: uncharacterized protein LOC105971542 [Erythranthe guttata]|eukprot:XP_012851847.1 PREDICTED: uncharacterized protein LOC105971542 [Erythranthe guttata]
MGGRSRKKPNKSTSRPARPSASSSGGRGRGLFVEGGVLSDWSPFGSPPSRGRKGNNGANGNSRPRIGKGSNSDPKSGSAPGQRAEAKKNTGNAISFQYPQQDNTFISGGRNRGESFDASNPVVLIDSEKTPIIAYFDEGPGKEPQNVEYMYDYTTSFTLEESSHRGLGFNDETETTNDGIEYESSSKIEKKEGDATDLSSSEMDRGANADVDEDLTAEVSSQEEDPGYVIIGGTKIYTYDTDEDVEEDVSDEGSSVSDDSSATSDSDGSSYSGSDIDDEIAADYFEGIGGVGNIVNVDQLVGKQFDLSDSDSDSEDSFDETVQKLGGIDLQDASRMYGKEKPGLARKYRRQDKELTPIKYTQSSGLDDLMLVKDPRTISGKKKNVAKFPQSWPSEARKSKKFRRIPGEKKKHRKETIAAKRRDRMVRRGVDLQKINLKFQQMVLDGIDIQSFPSMHRQDCSQVRRLASIYRLQSGCQGSGRKRYVTVIRTHQTCMPTPGDQVRLEKLIGANEKDADFSVIDGKPVKMDTYYAKKTARVGGTTPVGSQSLKKRSNKNKTPGKTGSYSTQPLSFVSSGIMDPAIVELTTTESTNETNPEKQTAASLEYGAFEMHTTGFGSKMLAKMGYVEGGGLGKDGQGVAKPIEVFQRPKSLGLGAVAPEASSSKQPTTNVKAQPKSVRSKSCGTKAKPAKIENNNFGSFEKHTKGFGSKMMAKMGFVEGAGLGKDAQGIINPLVAVRRPKSVGLGANKSRLV